MNFINLSKIDYINFNPSKRLNYKWFDLIEAEYKFFGLIKKRSAIRAGWGVDGSVERLSSDYLERYNYIFVMETSHSGSWYSKSSVYIRTKESSFQKHFKNDATALEYINSVEVSMKDKLIHL